MGNSSISFRSPSDEGQPVGYSGELGFARSPSQAPRQAPAELPITERIRPVAQPVDQYVAPPKPQRSALFDLAQSLSDIDGNLKGLAADNAAKGGEVQSGCR